MNNELVSWKDIPVPKGFILNDTSLGYTDKDKIYHYLAPAMGLTQGISSLETDIQSYMLQYRSPGGVTKIREVPATVLTGRDIEGLVAYGVGITPANKVAILRYFIGQRMLIPMDTVYEGVGWLSDGDFGLEQLISKDSQRKGFLKSDALDLAPKGSRTQWFKMWDTVSDSIPLQLALVIGLTAPLLRPLSQQFPDLETLLFSVVGDSSTGKSTMLALALSTAGANRAMQKGSLFQSWSGTANALSLRLNGNNGVPFGLDELSRYMGRNITGTIYNLASGTEKARATKTMSLRSTASWQTTIISTGERGLLDGMADQNQGLRMRVIECEGITWTRSSEEAELIKSVVANNYGWLFPDFVKAILTNATNLTAAFPATVSEVKSLMPDSKFRDRISTKLAVVEIAAQLANITWPEININVQEIMRLLIKSTTATWGTDLGDRVYARLLDYLKTNQGSLLLKGRVGQAGPHVIGNVSMTFNPVKMYVNLYPSEYTRIVTDELGAQSERVVTASLKEKGYIQSEPGRNTIRKIVDGKRVTFISILVPTSEENDFILRNSFDADGRLKNY
ncbi:DUF927 domain-containing protein [Levilactobacillus yiduensis]|uniref:DUF927 domain-containing protein n=1 Tax=Levilactobacillus yiduensis TaxID=2953880 RepID=UPI000EF3424B|nr:DUF927 domain-containing protein [Levilactobacillus yiduensis]AYM01494.1 DUF927 domain-containing protein [Levilactobacillus brevis]